MSSVGKLMVNAASAPAKLTDPFPGSTAGSSGAKTKPEKLCAPRKKVPVLLNIVGASDIPLEEELLELDELLELEEELLELLEEELELELLELEELLEEEPVVGGDDSPDPPHAIKLNAKTALAAIFREAR